MAQGQLRVFCDLDGTLIDVAPRHYRVYQEVVELYHGKPLPQTLYWQLKRKKTTWPQLLPQSGISADKVSDFLKAFIERIETPENLKIDSIFPGAVAALDIISKHHPCYLVSLRRNRQALLEQIEWLNLVPHFKEVLTGHSESDGYDVKIALIKQHLGDGGGAIIGDTEADIVTGQELGFKTFAVWSGIRDKQFLADLKPDHLLATISEVPPLL